MLAGTTVEYDPKPLLAVIFSVALRVMVFLFRVRFVLDGSLGHGRVSRAIFFASVCSGRFILRKVGKS
jgi:hypothetical protein